MKLAPATFPSATSLQPIPTYVHPNISGNVNSTSSPSPFIVPETHQNNPPPPTVSTPNHSWNPWWTILFLILLIVAAFAIVKRRKNNS